MNPIKDKRYTISKEYCGEKEKRFVLRFCNEFVMQSKFYQPLIVRAIGHQAEKRGAVIIEAIKN